MEGPKVITLAYDFIKWAIPHIVKFPRNQRYTLGERVENKLFFLLELLIEAQYSKDKANVLKKANMEIEQTRYLFRLCHDLRLINLKTYELSSRQLMGIGAQVGGWIKQQNTK
ncbi:MAG: diversity-generating retroelement protein Avd [Candidatus Saganbacteria bacterium]|nr:diversity-generating retroelement protein Avd [Candidatus Saganbacteria bacterium]